MQSTSLTADRQRLFNIIKKDAFFKERIVLSSGKTSDYYIDARRITLLPEGAFLCAKIMLDMVRAGGVDAIGGPTLGADPFVGAIGVLSFQAKKPINTFIIRKAPKPHGKQQQIEGPLLTPQSNIVLIDDVATTGKAFLESIDVLGKMGMKAAYALCVVDREEGAAEALRLKGCELWSIFKASEFLKT